MAEIISLRQARKRKRRSEEAKTAAGRRSVFGRTKSEKAETALSRELAAKRLDANKRCPPDEDVPL